MIFGRVRLLAEKREYQDMSVPWAAGANQKWFACIFSRFIDWIIRVPSAKWAVQRMFVDNDWFLFYMHLTTPSPVDGSDFHLCIRMIIDDGHLEKKYALVDSHKWMLSDQWPSWLHRRESVVVVIIIIIIVVVVSCVFLVRTKYTLNSWRSTMALYHHFSFSHADDDDDGDGDGDQHHSYILNIYRWHAHTFHMFLLSARTVWVSCNSWSSSICLWLCLRYSWLSPCPIRSLIKPSVDLPSEHFLLSNESLSISGLRFNVSKSCSNEDEHHCWQVTLAGYLWAHWPSVFGAWSFYLLQKTPFVYSIH